MLIEYCVHQKWKPPKSFITAPMNCFQSAGKKLLLTKLTAKLRVIEKLKKKEICPWKKRECVLRNTSKTINFCIGCSSRETRKFAAVKCRSATQQQVISLQVQPVSIVCNSNGNVSKSNYSNGNSSRSFPSKFMLCQALVTL